MPRIGWFGEDVWDAAADVVTSGADIVTDVFGAVPGSPELVEAIEDFVKGPLRDFAKSPVGMVVLRAMSTTIYGPWAYTLGPQLASIVFALPGLARGQDFWESWFDEVQWRTEKTAEILGADAATGVVPGLDKAIAKAKTMLPDDVVSKGLPELAAALGVDEWTAAMAIHTAFENIPMPPREDWDPFTWKRKADLAAKVGFATSINRWAYASSYDQPAATSVNRLAYAPQVRAPDAPPVRRAVASSFVGATPPSANKSIGDVVLGVTVVAAVGALVWFYAWDKKRV